MSTPIIDLHVHPSMKPFNNASGIPGDPNRYGKPKYEGPDVKPIDLWKELPKKKKELKKVSKLIQKFVSGTKMDSQSNLKKMSDGEFKAAFFTIHPAERGWFDFNNFASGEKKKIKTIFDPVVREAGMTIIGSISNFASALTGTSINKIIDIMGRVSERKNSKSSGIDYFNEETFKEYQLIVDQSAKTNLGLEYEVVNNFAEYKQAIAKGKLPAILNIEGMHALGSFSSTKLMRKKYSGRNKNKSLTDTEKRSLEKTYLNNIDRVKGLTNDSKKFNHIPFYITFSHFYYNFLAGHANSYGRLLGKIFNQNIGLNTGITNMGWKVIDKLLQKDKTTGERRILIDVKHMSVKARNEYYKFIDNKWTQGDRIPVIFSHGAVAAKKGFSENENDNKLPKTYFNQGSINVSDDDLKQISKTNGVFGLSFHEGRVPGPILRDILKSNKGKANFNKIVLKAILSQIFYVFELLKNETVKGWDILCIGSDYDGIMDPLDIYPTVADFKTFSDDLEAYLTHPTFDLYDGKNDSTPAYTPQQAKQLISQSGLTPKEITEKVCYKNLEDFLAKHFN